jgi:metal-dependent amidase/aminoacylase/carboxypeptidase family protein
MHTAGLALAMRILGRMPVFPGGRIFMFQAAEETGEGALDVLSSGFFDSHLITGAFTVHCKPEHLHDQAGFLTGPVCAGATGFRAELGPSDGLAGSLLPFLSEFPLTVAADLIQKSPSLVANKIDALHSAVLVPTQFHAGAAGDPLENVCVVFRNWGTGHGGRPHLVPNPVIAAANLVTSAMHRNQMFSKLPEPTISFTPMRVAAGNADNIIPSYVEVGLHLQVRDERALQSHFNSTHHIANTIADLHNVTAEVTFTGGRAIYGRKREAEAIRDAVVRRVAETPAVIRGRVRALDERVLEDLRGFFHRTITKSAGVSGLESNVDWERVCPVLVNDIDQSELMRRVVEDGCGDITVVPTPRSMGGEDFSWYAETGVPLTLVRAGTADPLDSRTSKPIHSEQFFPSERQGLNTIARLYTAFGTANWLLPRRRYEWEGSA